MHPYRICAIIIAHVLEELYINFAPFFNQRVLHSSQEWRPVSKPEALLKDCIGLAGTLVFLVLFGQNHPWAQYAAFGFLAADALQHFAYTVYFKFYTPGIVTASGYVWAVVNFLNHQPEPALPHRWIYFALGASGLALNILFGVVRARKYRSDNH